MSKLNKQEVKAIAYKLHKELNKIVKNAKEEIIKNYIPSETYSKIEVLIEERDRLLNESNRIHKELIKINSDINSISPVIVVNSNCKEGVLSYIIENECDFLECPSIEELKDEITIAAIDDNFDATSFIKNQVSKFNNYAIKAAQKNSNS